MNKQAIPMIAVIAIAAVVLTSLAILSENNILPGQNIPEDQTIRLAISNPEGKIWDYIYADGSMKQNWNIYIKPDYSVAKGFCTIDQLVGLWTIELHGTNYESLRFQHGPVILEGSEKHYTPERNVCP